MSIEQLLTQAPNFMGLIVCIGYLWQASKRQQAMIEHLVDVIIKKENCDDEPSNAQPSKPSA